MSRPSLISVVLVVVLEGLVLVFIIVFVRVLVGPYPCSCP